MIGPDRVRWLLANPLDYAEKALDPAYRATVAQPGGALLTAIVAVDR